MQEISNKIHFPELEKEILQFWRDEQIFQKSIDQRPEDRPFIFYDGPPFATGLPHHGHLVGSILKDVVPRYWTMKGKFSSLGLILSFIRFLIICADISVKLHLVIS